MKHTDLVVSLPRSDQRLGTAAVVHRFLRLLSLSATQGVVVPRVYMTHWGGPIGQSAQMGCKESPDTTLIG